MAKDIPTRKRFRHGSRRAFHLYHAREIGPIDAGAISLDVLSVGRALGVYRGTGLTRGEEG
jgi:hypothetical protein